MVRISHRTKFNPDEVKEMLGIATEKLGKYKEMASFLGSKKAKNEDIVQYFKRVFPVTGAKKNIETELSRNAKIAMSILDTQPGAEYAEGSWWQPFNAVTYMTDHLMGRNDDTRMTSAWFGPNRALKTRALETALEMAEAA